MELIEYNEGLKPFEELLGEIDRPGDYCTHGNLCVPMPLLQVEGVGTIPVPAVQAEALVATVEPRFDDRKPVSAERRASRPRTLARGLLGNLRLRQRRVEKIHGRSGAMGVALQD